MTYLDNIKNNGRTANPFFCQMGIDVVQYETGKAVLGMTVRPDDPHELQRALKHLLEYPAERLEKGRLARERVTLQFDRKLRIRRTLELYEGAFRKRGLL